jgi:hypothetical protein
MITIETLVILEIRTVEVWETVAGIVDVLNLVEMVDVEDMDVEDKDITK